MVFDDPRLIAKYGSWVRAFVEFYDGMAEGAVLATKREINDELRAEWIKGDVAYEELVGVMEELQPTFADAWRAFVEHATTH